MVETTCSRKHYLPLLLLNKILSSKISESSMIIIIFVKYKQVHLY